MIFVFKSEIIGSVN